MRRQITSGTLAPETRLPPTRELARRWHVNNETIGRALAPLTAEGLLVRAPKRGTFVRAATDKTLIGVLFGPSLTDETAHFYRAMLKAFSVELRERKSLRRSFDGLFVRLGSNDPDEAHARRHLISELGHHRFSGLIEFAFSSYAFPDLALARTQPRVCFESSRADTDAVVDSTVYGRTSVEFLARLGRRRIAVFLPNKALSPGKLDAIVSAAASEMGLPQPRMVEVSLPPRQGYEVEQAAFNAAVEMLRGWARLNDEDRPDALLVSDDIIMRAVALALIKERVRVPEDLLVITQASEGVELHYGIPVVRYEFSTREMARALVDLLWKRMQGADTGPLPIRFVGKIRAGNP
ncbi:MAG: substrate-binding domain-containing protein [Kiritimatiellae bacterium]|nr:substrate-binding domain-containing protein [Kiritimatiellia bacterium]